MYPANGGCETCADSCSHCDSNGCTECNEGYSLDNEGNCVGKKSLLHVHTPYQARAIVFVGVPWAF